MRSIAIIFITILLLASILITGCASKETSVTTAAATTPPETNNPVQTTQPSSTTEPPETTITITTPAATTEPPATTEPAEPVKHFQATSPAVKFTDDDIAFLGIDFSGTPSQIADSIMKWQQDTWIYASEVMDYRDVSDPIRWNYFLPGIFTSKEIIHEQVRNGKIYGICFSYAITYCSIAEYYGLEARVVNSISKPSDSMPNVGSTTGMSTDEYARLKIKLDAAGLNYSYETVRLVADETPGHYWAEVKINGQWVVKDATPSAPGSNTKIEYIDTGDFEITDWLSLDRSSELDDYQALLSSGETLPDSDDEEDSSGPITPAADYVGVTDDLGQTQRAANVDDVMLGLALVPYFNNVSDAFEFAKIMGASQSDIDEEQLLKASYEQQSGKKMYAAALLMCDDKTGEDLAEAYFNLCGEELDLEVYEALLALYE